MEKIQELLETDPTQVYRKLGFTGFGNIFLHLSEFLVENYQTQVRHVTAPLHSRENPGLYAALIAVDFSPDNPRGRPTASYITTKTELEEDNRPSTYDDNFHEFLREHLTADGALLIMKDKVEATECKFGNPMGDVLHQHNVEDFQDIAHLFIDEPYYVPVGNKQRMNFGTRTLTAIALPLVGEGRSYLLRQSINSDGMPAGLYEFGEYGLRRKLRVVKRESVPESIGSKIDDSIIDSHNCLIESSEYYPSKERIQLVERTYMPITMVDELRERFDRHIKQHIRRPPTKGLHTRAMAPFEPPVPLDEDVVG